MYQNENVDFYCNQDELDELDGHNQHTKLICIVDTFFDSFKEKESSKSFFGDTLATLHTCIHGPIVLSELEHFDSDIEIVALLDSVRVFESYKKHVALAMRRVCLAALEEILSMCKHYASLHTSSLEEVTALVRQNLARATGGSCVFLGAIKHKKILDRLLSMQQMVPSGSYFQAIEKLLEACLHGARNIDGVLRLLILANVFDVETIEKSGRKYKKYKLKPSMCTYDILRQAHDQTIVRLCSIIDTDRDVSLEHWSLILYNDIDHVDYMKRLMGSFFRSRTYTELVDEAFESLTRCSLNSDFLREDFDMLSSLFSQDETNLVFCNEADPPDPPNRVNENGVYWRKLNDNMFCVLDIARRHVVFAEKMNKLMARKWAGHSVNSQHWNRQDFFKKDIYKNFLNKDVVF